MEDEIDLRKYIDVLLRHWKLIVSITVIAVLVTGLVSFLMPPTYEAEVAVLVIKGRSEITFEPKYVTYFQEDIASQRRALVALVKSSAVAIPVIKQLEDELEPAEKRPESILDKVQVREQGDLIQIVVRSTDPEKAAAIAGTWGNCYQSYVNSLYGGVCQSPGELQAQANAARNEYEEKQKAWEDFLRENRVDELTQQVADKELLYDVKSLREQISAGSSSSASVAANGLALILLQSSAFAELPAELQVSLDRLSALNPSLKDIDALISTLEARSGGTRGQSISELRRETNRLRAELEQETAKELELESSRDIAWEAYKTVAGKVVEAGVAVRAQDAVVRVAEVVAVPQVPVAPRKVMNISIAFVLGLVIGVLGAFGVEYFQKTGDRPEGGKGEEEVG
jgi:succinoglycan biosynthesis transport protein ExoP